MATAFECRNCQQVYEELPAAECDCGADRWRQFDTESVYTAPAGLRAEGEDEYHEDRHCPDLPNAGVNEVDPDTLDERWSACPTCSGGDAATAVAMADGGTSEQIPDECISCDAEPTPAGDACWECPECGLTGCGIEGCNEGHDARTDGGSKYVRETGDGYLGVFGVDSRKRTQLGGDALRHLGLDDGDDADIVAAEDGVAITTEPGDRKILDAGTVTNERNYPLFSVGGPALDALGVGPDDDVRAYEHGSDEVLLVDADDDPRVMADGDQAVDEKVQDGGVDVHTAPEDLPDDHPLAWFDGDLDSHADHLQALGEYLVDVDPEEVESVMVIVSDEDGTETIPSFQADAVLDDFAFYQLAAHISHVAHSLDANPVAVARHACHVLEDQQQTATTDEDGDAA